MIKAKPLILYFTANFPSKEILSGFIDAIDSGIVKYVEIGIPTVNPLYDGPTIKTTHKIGRSSFRMEDVADFASKLAKKGVKTFILAYYETIRQGKAELLDFLAGSGIQGIIVPDLLTDYFPSRIEVIREIEEKLEFIPFFNPATPDSVIREICSVTSSWIYYGLQPSTGINVPYDLKEVSRRIVELANGREINFGFGVRSASQVAEIISLGSSGVAIGSLLVKMLKENDLDSFRKFQEELKEAIDIAN